MVIQFFLSTTLSRVRRISKRGNSSSGVSSIVKNSTMIAGDHARGGGCERDSWYLFH